MFAHTYYTTLFSIKTSLLALQFTIPFEQANNLYSPYMQHWHDHYYFFTPSDARVHQMKPLAHPLVSSRVKSSRLVLRRLTSRRLVSSRLTSSRLVSCHFVSSCLVSPRLISSCVVSYRLVSYRLVSYRLVSCCVVSPHSMHPMIIYYQNVK